MKNAFDTIHIYVPETKQIIRISEGTGDNLLDEDIDEGFVDYIYYETFNVEDTIEEDNGGQVMLTELFREQYKCTEDCVPDVLDMEYGNREMGYIVL